MSSAADVKLAEARVEAARARLNGTMGSLQTQLEPRTLARTLGDAASQGALSATQATSRAVRRNPAGAAGALALLGAFLGRKRIGRAVRRLASRVTRRHDREPAPRSPEPTTGAED